MDDVFKITGKERFLIYGASFVGKQFCHALLDQGINVWGFWDRDAATIGEVEGIQVYDPENNDMQINTSDIVIIAISDASEHVRVANFLYDKGFRKIILKANIGETQFGAVYDSILSGDNIKGLQSSYYEKVGWDISKIECMYVEEKQDAYLVEIPTELLFYREKGKACSIYENNPLLLYYNFIEGRDGIDMLEGYCEDKAVELSRWMERERVEYRHMSENWESGRKAGIPVVSRDHKGRFCLETCVRETTFYVAKGYKKVECEVSKTDYAFWNKPDLISQCIDIMEKNHVSCVYTPILHPFFNTFPCKREECGQTRLMKLCQYLKNNKIEVRNKKVLDAGTYIGYFAQHMWRMGAEVSAVEFDYKNYELAKKLNELLYCDEIDLKNIGIQDIDGDAYYDIVIMFSVLNWHLDTELGEQIMKKIDQVTKGILLWESGDEIEREKKWILEHSSFNSYEKISDSFGTGKIREMGCFRRK